MASALSDALARHKIVTDRVTTLIDAHEAARLLSYDAILLDRQLTDGEGLKLIPELRPEGIDVPIIVAVTSADRREEKKLDSDIVVRRSSAILLAEAARSRCKKCEGHVRPRPMSQDDPKVRAAIGGYYADFAAVPLNNLLDQVQPQASTAGLR